MAQQRHHAITVRDLLETPSLQLSLVAGGSGLDRPVSWTQVSELREPDLWLDGGELLMSNGLGLAGEGEAQAELILRLDQRRAAGLGLGVRAPALSAQMRAEADRRGFPLLAIPRQIPFLSIARMVADANQDNAQRRLLTHVRIFDTLRPNGEPDSPQRRVARLRPSRATACTCSVQLAPLLQGLGPVAAEIVELIRGRSAIASPCEIPRLPGGHIVEVPAGRDGAFLIAVEQADREPAGLGAVRHIATVVALELTRLYVERRVLRRHGGEVLANLFAGVLDGATVERLLADASFDSSMPLLVFALRDTTGCRPPEDEIDHRLCDLGVAHFVLLDGDVLFGLIPAAGEVLGEITASLAVRVGVSRARRGLAAWAVARKEALWGLEHAAARRNGLAQLAGFPATEAPVHWLPSDMGTLESLVEDTVGSLLRYDREHNSTMFESLRVFFEHDRALAAAAAELHVHKHTLSHRLGRIEEITSRDLSRMADLVPLWLAVQAHRIVASRDRAPVR